MFIQEAPPDTATVKVWQGDNPFMTVEKREAFERDGNFTQAEAKARIYGEFEFIGSRVFEGFNPEVHVIPPTIPSRAWVHGITVDPHHKRPCFMLFWAYNSHLDQFIFYREWPNVDFFQLRGGGRSPQEYTVIIRQTEASVERKLAIYRCDPRFGKAEHKRHGVKESAWVQLMAEQGLHFDANIPNIADIEYGHQVINKRFHYDKNYPIEGTNQPKVLITEECPNLIQALLNYAYVDDGNLETGLHRKVSEEYKDPIDTMRYTVLKPIFNFNNWDVGSSFSEQEINSASQDDYF
jgi:hypothetical protein